MKQYPKYTKYKKYHKGKLFKLEYKSNSLKFGEVGLKATESGTINFRQIEAARQAISRKIKRKGRVWIRIFPNLPVTKKSTGARMGKGKGSVSHWVAKVRSGSVLFEVCGINIRNILDGLKTGGAKLPVRTKIFF
jgi:large subunit ribosomal protein L16